MINNHKEIGRKICHHENWSYIGLVDGKYLAQQKIETKETQIDEKTWKVGSVSYQEWDITNLMLETQGQD